MGNTEHSPVQTAQTEIGKAEGALENAMKAMENEKGKAADQARAALVSAGKALRRAARKVAVVAAIAVGLAVAGPSAEAQDGVAEPDPSNSSVTLVSGDDGPWSITVADDRMEGLTGITAHNVVESDAGTKGLLRLRCEIGEAAPDVMVVVGEANGGLIFGIDRQGGMNMARMRFGQDQAFDQGFVKYSDSTYVVSDDSSHPGLGSSKMAEAIADADSVLFKLNVRGTYEHFEFDTSSPELSRTVDKMAEVCEMRTKDQLAIVSAQDVNVAVGHDDTGVRRSGGRQSASTWLEEPSHECNRGLFSREAERGVGAVVGGIAGAILARRAGDDDHEGRNTAVGGLLGALAGSKIGSKVGQRLEGRRAEGSVGNTRHYPISNGETMSFATLSDGSYCVTRTNEQGQEVTTKRFSPSKGAEMERPFERAMGQQQRQSRSSSFTR